MIHDDPLTCIRGTYHRSQCELCVEEMQNRAWKARAENVILLLRVYRGEPGIAQRLWKALAELDQFEESMKEEKDVKPYPSHHTDCNIRGCKGGLSCYPYQRRKDE
jgi:hypothetical protein